MRSSRINIFFLLLIPALLIGVGLVFYLPSSASAAALQQDATPTPDPLTIGNDVCLSCHELPGQTMQLDNDDVIDLTVYSNEFSASIHGKQGYACVQCHRTVGNYPHPAVTFANAREFAIEMNKACGTCHEPQVLLTQDSVHAQAFISGKREAAVCTDCHGSHNVEQWTDSETGELLQTARLRIPQTCANCHNDIYQKYSDSVHGAALYDENNTDVPTCIDCHGVHNIENPTTAAFRLASPQICAKCHTDSAIMQKYGLSTEVLDTYVADFHGTTVTVFEKQSPDAETNKPVCYDCHGIHDIKRTDNPTYGIHLQQNLLVRCQTCHPGATANFPTAWLSHYIPSTDNNALVYYVNLFYKFFIPGVLVPMALLVALDVGHTLYRKSRGKFGKHAAEEHVPEQPTIEAESAPAATPTESAQAQSPVQPTVEAKGTPETLPTDSTKAKIPEQVTPEEPPSPPPADTPPPAPSEEHKADEEASHE